MTQARIEVYVGTEDVDALVEFMARAVGELREFERSGDIVFFRRQGLPGRLIVTPGVEDGSFVGLELSGAEWPWGDAFELSRFIANGLDVPVRFWREAWFEMSGGGSESPTTRLGVWPEERARSDPSSESTE